tara:strand:- start:1320 stop:1961 length:642 start_codon:yes stop_codon:yes gene_type:complete
MGSVAVGAMVVGTSLLVVFALAMATLESQVEDSIAQIEATAEPIAKFSIQNANNVDGAVVSFTINDGGTGYSPGQVEINGSAGSFLANLQISGGVVTGLEVLNYGSSYLYNPSLYFLEVVGPNTGTNLSISVTIGKLVFANITNDGSTDINTDFSWLFIDSNAPINLSSGITGYSQDTIFPGETFEFIHDNSNSTANRVALTIDGRTIAASVN